MLFADRKSNTWPIIFTIKHGITKHLNERLDTLDSYNNYTGDLAIDVTASMLLDATNMTLDDGRLTANMT